MKSAFAGSFIVFFALAPFLGVASAASIDSTYDMNRMLNEPHPLANDYGTRWRPAPVQPRAPLPAQPAAQPRAMPMVPPPVPPLAIAPPVLLPAAPPADPSAITPNLTLDETGAPKAPTPTAAAAPAAAPPAAPSATPPASGRDGKKTADGGLSTARVGARPTRANSTGDPWVSEIRLGALYHDEGPFSHKKETGVDTNVELLFRSPELLKFIWSPRPHIGAGINSSGDTSKAYLGLSWEWEFWRYMFGGFSLGGAVHDGKTTNAPLDRKELGCRVLFRESVEIGFRFAERHSISGFLDHISNAKLCSTNEGLESSGIRYGYKF